MSYLDALINDYLILQTEWASFTWLKDQWKKKKKGLVMRFCTQIAPLSLSGTIYCQGTTNRYGNIHDHCMY